LAFFRHRHTMLIEVTGLRSKYE